MSTVTVSGTAWRALRDSNFPADCPDHWATLNQAAVVKRHGQGHRVTVPLGDAAREAAHHLDSIADAVGAMSAAEREGESTHPLRRAAQALRGPVGRNVVIDTSNPHPPIRT